jgi:hypothetical protein
MQNSNTRNMIFGKNKIQHMHYNEQNSSDPHEIIIPKLPYMQREHREILYLPFFRICSKCSFCLSLGGL